MENNTQIPDGESLNSKAIDEFMSLFEPLLSKATPTQCALCDEVFYSNGDIICPDCKKLWRKIKTILKSPDFLS